MIITVGMNIERNGMSIVTIGVGKKFKGNGMNIVGGMNIAWPTGMNVVFRLKIDDLGMRGIATRVGMTINM